MRLARRPGNDQDVRKTGRGYTGAMWFSDESALEQAGERAGQAVGLGSAPHVMALVGELGAGKTAFTRGVARGLGVQETTTSPTFVLAKQYPVPGGKTLWHIDAYRLRGSEDLEALDFATILGNEQHIVVIEWADRIHDAIPESAAWITFDHHPDGRTVTGLEAYGIKEEK